MAFLYVDGQLSANVCRKIDLVPKVTLFIMATRQLQHLKDYPLGSIGNMDEAPLWLDMPGATTITHSGERSVPVRTTGHEKN